MSSVSLSNTSLHTSVLRMVDLLQDIMKHNFYSSLIVISGVILTLHYTTMTTSSYGCPIIVAYGDPETGKTKTLNTALALLGKSSVLT